MRSLMTTSDSPPAPSYTDGTMNVAALVQTVPTLEIRGIGPDLVTVDISLAATQCGWTRRG